MLVQKYIIAILAKAFCTVKNITRSSKVFRKPLTRKRILGLKSTYDGHCTTVDSFNNGVVCLATSYSPGPFGPSTIGAGGLNGRVRDGYAWNPSAIATKHAFVEQTLSI